MKTLDVQALHKAIDHTLEQLKQQSEEIVNLKKCVEGITSLNDALKGKGGDAIRNFYKECHTPFLQFYETFIEEYQSALKKIKSALNSLEPQHNGYISQTFLDNELEQGVKDADRTTKRLVSKTNATIAKVSHIVDLPELDDSDFHENYSKALKEINQTIEKLHTFDREQTNILKTAENDLETMQRYIARLEKMYTGPKIEIADYQKGSILKPDKMDTLSGNQETAMGVMLDKLDKRSKLEKEVSEANKQVNKISHLKEKLENVIDPDEFVEIAKEIGIESLTEKQQYYYFYTINRKRKQSGIMGRIKQGIEEGIEDVAVDTVTGIRDTITNPKETLEGITYTVTHPVETFEILKKDIENSFVRDVINGDAESRARWFTYATGMVASSIVGTKGADKVSKLAKAGKVGQAGAKAAKVSKKAVGKGIKASKKAIQNATSKLKEVQIHNPFAPQVQFAGGGKLPYNAIDGENFKKALIQRIEKVSKVDKTAIGINKATSEKVVNALSNFKSKKMTFGDQHFLLDKKGMKHILERHHPEYWDGSVKTTQSFFKKDLSIDDITKAIESILKQNRDTLTDKGFRGTTGKQQLTGTYNGVKYVVGFKKGRIGQFYPVE
ncbi:T7SS effector LXG polymorphic toxin [Bacillus paralicheniformis]|uniref:T7SS effector LXG polymorphic toxin n=1 Tax=Bacillus paralicheniformis TaxID=1648923 RepID=UPI00214CF21A|nr:T7SS effector LXG polymorphic toxin [Bacillus paralicheniformis]WHX88036.1 T7SS effector LXG polymorphic toxin [Bacillus paralicheniformis]